MGLRINQLVSQFSEGFSNGISRILGQQKTSQKYPNSVGGVEIQRITNRPAYDDGAWRGSLGYSFEVCRIDESGFCFSEPGWQEFRLQINPQELTQDEIFAIEVTPTFRGVIVEHHGTVLKDIVMSGTTGVSPGRRDGGANKSTGRAVLASGHSGYEEFHELRSYFRAYVEHKRVDDRTKGELRMVFRNFKDNEFLYVEPQKFTMKKTKDRRTLYDYTIMLKGIGVAEAPTHGGSNKGIIGSIADVINKTSDAFGLATQVIEGGIGILRRTERDVSNTLLGPMRQINNMLQAIKGGKEALFGEFGVTRRFLLQFKNEAERIEGNFNDVIGRDTTSYNNATGRTSTLVAPSGRQATFQEFQILNAINRAKRATASLLSERSFFSEDAFAGNRRVEEAYTGRVVIQDPNSVRQYQISGLDTIQTLAARELGNADRYKDIVSLNNLKPPYIDPAGGDGVLKPGDTILLPKSDQIEDTGVKKNREFNITKLLSETEQNLGVDIRIDENNDLAISNIKDLDLIAGIPNMSQAIAIRIGLEPGDLKRHLHIGTGLKIGEKTRTNFLNDIRRRLISSLGSDLRVESIPFLELRQDGGTTQINALIKLKDLAQPVPLPITLENG